MYGRPEGRAYTVHALKAACESWKEELPFAGYSAVDADTVGPTFRSGVLESASTLFDKIVWDDPDSARFASYVVAGWHSLFTRAHRAGPGTPGN